MRVPGVGKPHMVDGLLVVVDFGLLSGVHHTSRLIYQSVMGLITETINRGGMLWDEKFIL